MYLVTWDTSGETEWHHQADWLSTAAELSWSINRLNYSKICVFWTLWLFYQLSVLSYWSVAWGEQNPASSRYCIRCQNPPGWSGVSPLLPVSPSSSAGVSVLCLLLARLRLSAVVCAEGYRGGAAVAGGAGGRQMNQLAGGQINTVVVWGEDARRSDGLQPSERRSEEEDGKKLGCLSAWSWFHFWWNNFLKICLEFSMKCFLIAAFPHRRPRLQIRADVSQLNNECIEKVSGFNWSLNNHRGNTESWCLLRPPLHQDRSISMTSKRISTSTCCFTASPSVLQEWTDTWKRFFHLTNSLISQNLSRITFKCPLSSFLFSSLLPFQHLWFKSIDKFKVEKKSKNPRALRTQTGSSIHPLKSL